MPSTAEYQDPELDAFRATNLLYPLATALGYLLHQLRLLMREQASQATPMGATGSNLDDWLEISGVIVPGESTATGSVSVTGGNNKSIEAGTEIILGGQLIYTTNTVVNFGPTESTISVAVTAEATGAAYNAAIGEKLELAVVDDDIQPFAVSQGIRGGSSPADDAVKKALLKARWSQSQIAGSAKGYELLALGSASNIGRVFIIPEGHGSGTVSVFPLLVLTQGQEYYAINLPNAGDVAALQSYLEADDVARINDDIRVQAPTTRAVPIDVSITPNTTEVQEAIRATLRQRFFDAYDVAGTTIVNSEIAGAISSARGETSHTLNDVDGNGPAGDATRDLRRDSHRRDPHLLGPSHERTDRRIPPRRSTRRPLLARGPGRQMGESHRRGRRAHRPAHR